MRGIPKVLATKADYELLKELYPEEHKKRCQELLDNQYVWEPQAVLAEKDIGKTDSSNKVIENVDEKGVVIKMQMTKVLDSASKLLRLGFTADEVFSELPEDWFAKMDEVSQKDV